MASKIKNDKLIKESTSLTESILKELGMKANVTATTDEDIIKIDITGEDLGLLIGYRGENLEHLQLILGIMINKKLALDNWIPVVVDVGGWKKEREEQVRNLVDREVKKISAEKPEVELPAMPPDQRRIAHLAIEEYPGLTSQSAGEEPFRYVIIQKEEEVSRKAEV